MFESEESNPEPDRDPAPTPPQPPATEEEIVDLDNYVEKGLRQPDENEHR